MKTVSMPLDDYFGEIKKAERTSYESGLSAAYVQLLNYMTGGLPPKDPYPGPHSSLNKLLKHLDPLKATKVEPAPLTDEEKQTLKKIQEEDTKD